MAKMTNKDFAAFVARMQAEHPEEYKGFLATINGEYTDTDIDSFGPFYELCDQLANAGLQ